VLFQITPLDKAFSPFASHKRNLGFGGSFFIWNTPSIFSVSNWFDLQPLRLKMLKCVISGRLQLWRSYTFSDRRIFDFGSLTDLTDMARPLPVPLCARNSEGFFFAVMVVKSNTVVLWFTTLCSLVGAYRRFGRKTSGDGSSTFLQNDGNLNTQGLNNGLSCVCNF